MQHLLLLAYAYSVLTWCVLHCAVNHSTTMNHSLPCSGCLGQHTVGVGLGPVKPAGAPDAVGGQQPVRPGSGRFAGALCLESA